jgi:signal transduction histidine kinase
MPEQAVSKAQFSLGSSQDKERDLTISEPLCALGRLVAIMSHDLRLPLAAILANAEFLTRRP